MSSALRSTSAAAPRPTLPLARRTRPLLCPPAAAWLDPRRAASTGEQRQQAPPAERDAAPPAPPPTKRQQQDLLEQTAKHLLELNQRRAELAEENALLTREKHELAARLAAAEAELARATKQLSRLAAAEAAAAATTTTAPAPPAEPAQPPPPASPPAAFTIEYHSGWPRAFAHYCPRGGSWTSAPGAAMQRRPRADDGARHVFVLELDEAGEGLEFALTDGAGEWDNGGGSNYRIEGRGFSWRVRSGRVERL